MVVDLFLTHGDASLASLEESLRSGSTDAWKASAHKLKGSAAQIGADELAALCLQAEKDASLSVEDKKEVFARIQSIYEQIRKLFEARGTAELKDS